MAIRETVNEISTNEAYRKSTDEAYRKSTDEAYRQSTDEAFRQSGTGSASHLPPSIPLDQSSGSRTTNNRRTNMEATKSIDQKDREFSVTRYRLDQLDYKDWFDPLSTPLVKRLLADLVSTTQAAREWKSIVDGLQEQVRVLEEQVGPLRKELVGMESENGVLHREIIELQDSKDAMQKQFLAQTRKSEKEVQEMRFLKDQLQIQVAQERDKAKEAFKKVEELGEKVGIVVGGDRPIGQVPKSVRQKLFERVQKIDIETGLAPLDDATAGAPFPLVDPVYIDLVKVAEERGSVLQVQLDQEKSKVTSLQEEIQIVLNQVGKRDREITRLSSQLELARAHQFSFSAGNRGGGDHDEYGEGGLGITDLGSAKDRIQTLELQVESLSTHIESLEEEISQMQGQKIQVLTRITDEKKQVELDLDKERKKSESLLKSVEKMEGVVCELEGLRRGVTTNSTIIKPSTAVKNAKLVQELTLKLNTAAVKNEQSAKRLTMMQKDVSKLQNENVKLKQTVAELDQQIKNHPSSIPSIPNVSTQGGQTNEQTTNDLREKLKNAEGQVSILQSKINTLQGNISSQSTQFQLLASKLDVTDGSLQDAKIQVRNLKTELGACEAERDALRGAVDTVGERVDEVWSLVNNVVKERDSARELYTQVHDELERLRKSKTAQTSPIRSVGIIGSGRDAGATTFVEASRLAHLQAENEELKKKVDEWKSQVQVLKEDMKALVLRQRENGSLAGEAVTLLEKELDELKKLLDDSELEKNEIKKKLKICQDAHASLEKSNEMHVKQSEIDGKKVTQLELDTEKLRLELRQVHSSKSDAETKLRGVEKQLVTLQATVRDRERFMGDQKALLEDIGKERDGFQRDLDSKAEKLRELESQNEILRKEYNSCEKNCMTLTDQVEALTKHLNTSDRECSSLARQLQEAVSALQHWEDQAQQYHNEGQRLSSDLVALTRENQILNSEMGEASSVRDKYRSELIECETQLENLNELVLAKEEEKKEVLNNYRKLIADHERLEHTYRSNMEESNNLRMELVSRDKKIGSLEKQLDAVSRDATQFQIDNNAHTKQQSNLSRALATSERQIKQLEADKLRLTREIQAARELAHSVDRSKESINAQFVQLSLEYERASSKLEKTNVEMQALESQLRTEMLKAEKLEQLLNSERTRKIQTERSGHDLKHAQDEMEHRLKLLNEQQEVSLAATKGQLNDARKALQASESRISHLEVLLAQKDQEKSEAILELQNNKGEIVDLKAQIKSLEKNIADVVLAGSSKQSIHTESKIMNALQQTQREKAHTSQMIELSQTPKRPEQALQQDVLDVIVQETKDKE